jgi:hypothetical protein
MFAFTLDDHGDQRLAIDRSMHMTRAVTENSAAW